MSTAMVSLGIATGFERGYGVLKRLGSTPLGRPRLLGAKIVTDRGWSRSSRPPSLIAVGLRPRLEPGRARLGWPASAPSAIVLLATVALRRHRALHGRACSRPR